MTVVARAIRRGGVRVARVDRIPGGHAALVRLIARAIPRLFNAKAAAGLDETFELRIIHPRRAKQDAFALVIADGRLSVIPGPAPQARASVSIGADDLVLLTTGEIGWPALLAGGRLLLSGDPFLALRFPRLFDLPAEAGDPVILSAMRQAPRAV
jgi:hypothetical protein